MGIVCCSNKGDLRKENIGPHVSAAHCSSCKAPLAGDSLSSSFGQPTAEERPETWELRQAVVSSLPQRPEEETVENSRRPVPLKTPQAQARTQDDNVIELYTGTTSVYRNNNTETHIVCGGNRAVVHVRNRTAVPSQGSLNWQSNTTKKRCGGQDVRSRYLCGVQRGGGLVNFTSSIPDAVSIPSAGTTAQPADKGILLVHIPK